MITLVENDGIAELSMGFEPNNEIGVDFIQQLHTAVIKVARSKARVLIIYSSLANGFSSGGHLAELYQQMQVKKPRDLQKKFTRALNEVNACFDRIASLPIVTISVVNGICFGGGFELALTTDVIVAESTARFAFPELRLGLIPGMGGLTRLKKFVNPGVVADLLYTGRSINAQKAHNLGLVSQVLPTGQGLVVARRLAQQVCSYDRKVIREVKRTFKTDVAEEAMENQQLFGKLFARSTVRNALRDFNSRRDILPYIARRTRLKRNDDHPNLEFPFDDMNSLSDMFELAIETHKVTDCLIEVDREQEKIRYTYAQLGHELRRLAGLIQSTGARGGDRAAIMMSNQSKWPISALAIFHSGMILVPIDYKLSPKEQLNLLQHAEVKVLFVEFAIYQKLKPLLDNQAITVIVSDAPSPDVSSDWIDWQRIPVNEGVPVKRGRSDVACIIYTSGTNGEPKGCMMTHANYIEQAKGLSAFFYSRNRALWRRIFNKPRVFSLLPSNHAIDFMTGIILPIIYGGQVIHQRALRPEYLRSTMKRYKITQIALVPRLLEVFRSGIDERLKDLTAPQRRIFTGLKQLNKKLTAKIVKPGISRILLKPIQDELGGALDIIWAGGSYVNPETIQFFYDLGIPVSVGYGLTEACTVISLNDLAPFKADTVGIPINGTKVTIDAPNADGVGVILVSGPTVMSGYFRNPQATAEVLQNGWLNTGDLGRLLDNRHLQILGRTKNMVVTTGGKNVYPEDVEILMGSIEGVEEMAVLSSHLIWPGQHLQSEELIAVLRIKGNYDVALGVKNFQQKNNSLPEYKRISSYFLLDEEFPKTATLKIKRPALIAMIRTVKQKKLENAS